MSAPQHPRSPSSGSVARTQATGAGAMDPALLAWTSSFAQDRSLARGDLLGSAAHVTMLHQVGLIAGDDAKALRDALLTMFGEAEAGTLALADDEEDVHMAIEARLTRDLGEVGKRLHTARSRNDQVSLALRLHVRTEAADVLREVVGLTRDVLARAEVDSEVILPAYTHRQRAQPISAGFLMCAWTSALLRGAELSAAAMDTANVSPLGSCACSGTSLPIDRSATARLLGFPAITTNALDTIGDRDFAIDFTYAGARILLALARIATDVIDFTTSEFAYLRIGDAIAAGSSMMPQKKNPDVFELVRGKAALGVGHLSHMLTLVKGLPTGYARDLQDDREPVLTTGPTVRGALRAVKLGLPHLAFDRARCLAGVSDGSTQATDLAEALVRRGVPFREAYKATGSLVQYARSCSIDLPKVRVDDAQKVHPAFDAEILGVLDPASAVAAKKSAGGTAPERVHEQILELRQRAGDLEARAARIPTLAELEANLRAVAL